MPGEQNTAVTMAMLLNDRLLGNADDQAILTDFPNRDIDFGILYSQYEADHSRRGERSRFKPNAMTVRFEVSTPALTQGIRLSIVPTFWVYFRRDTPLTDPSVADLLSDEVIWTPWETIARPAPAPAPVSLSPQDPHAGEEKTEDGEKKRWFIRKRFASRIEAAFDPTQGQFFPSLVKLDLENFFHQYRYLTSGKTCEWSAAVQISVTPGHKPGRSLITVQLQNTCSKSPDYQRQEFSLFDARTRIEINTPIQHVPCPLLDQEYEGAPAWTSNCAITQSSLEGSVPGFLVATQSGLVLRYRKLMRDSILFTEGRDPGVMSKAVEEIAGDVASLDADQAANLRSAIQILGDNAEARQALAIVGETFALVMNPSFRWRRHQLAILYLGILEYLIHPGHPLTQVINVPTAGGKTESFVALALWTIAYEYFKDSSIFGISILKYPTTMLSDDQTRRLAVFTMAFDQVMGHRIEKYSPRGMGIFFGKKGEYLDPRQKLGSVCLWPGCGAAWNSPVPDSFGRGSRLVCAKGHSLTIAMDKEVFYLRPALLLATSSKMVAQKNSGLMEQLLGGVGYICDCDPSHPKKFTNKPSCWKKGSPGTPGVVTPHKEAKARSRVTLWVLDEAHLIREGSGVLASHFESFFLDLATRLGGRAPLAVVATATIAHARRHIRHLGLGDSQVFPSENGQGADAAYYTSSKEIHHVVLSCVPRGRALVWAMPHLVREYFRLLETHPEFAEYRPPLLYLPSYLIREQVRNGIDRQVNDSLRNDGKQALRMEEFSRMRFQKGGVEPILQKLKNGEIDVVLSTSISSVGIDLGELQSIIYFGAPSNVSEFIQSLNRVGRRAGKTGFSILLINPYSERDVSYFSFLEPFILFPEKMVEAIPLNRFARKAIDFTFDSIAMRWLYYWKAAVVRSTSVKGGPFIDITLPHIFRQAHTDGRIRDNEMEEILAGVFRSSEDTSGAYPRLVSEKWKVLVNQIKSPSLRPRNPGPWGPRIADAVQNELFSLIPPSDEGSIELDHLSRAICSSNVTALYAGDAHVEGDLQDEESGLALSELKEKKDTGPEVES